MIILNGINARTAYEDLITSVNNGVKLEIDIRGWFSEAGRVRAFYVKDGVMLTRKFYAVSHVKAWFYKGGK